MMQYQVQQSDRHSKGRIGLLTTGHAEVETPAFMPVGLEEKIEDLESDIESGRETLNEVCIDRDNYKEKYEDLYKAIEETLRSN